MATASPSSGDRARAFLAEVRSRVDGHLEGALPVPGPGLGRLVEALRHSLLAGGKRLRPALALAASRALGGRPQDVMPFAAALEMVHTYSLIHDDLPAMDDDDLRRGRPTSHKVFGEAMAILAGDALQTMAFESVLGGTDDADLARDLARLLATASGPEGMVGGQVEDIGASGDAPDEARLRRIQARKTGALIRAACRGGARAAGAAEEVQAALDAYGAHLGVAFQMIDDVLDVTGTAEALGKTPGKDVDEGRMTWVALRGVAGARAGAEAEIEQALAAVAPHTDDAILADLARFVLARDR